MAVPGLSLVSFMDEAAAIRYLRERCVTADPSEAALRNAYHNANGRFGGPARNPGQPEIVEIPDEHAAYLTGVATMNPRFATTIAGMESSFKLVEIAPLLAYQFHVATDRTDELCA